jgi:hypothetical protein
MELLEVRKVREEAIGREWRRLHEVINMLPECAPKP